jgi:hypothetical protein
MRRWFATLLLVFLPLQFSWAAVSSYCGHEAGTEAAHVGHHDHEGHSHPTHGVDLDQNAKPDDTASGALDLDCGHCHGYCAGLLDMACGFVAQAHGNAPPATVASPRAERAVAPPERPQWSPLA